MWLVACLANEAAGAEDLQQAEVGGEGLRDVGQGHAGVVHHLGVLHMHAGGGGTTGNKCRLPAAARALNPTPPKPKHVPLGCMSEKLSRPQAGT